MYGGRGLPYVALKLATVMITTSALVHESELARNEPTHRSIT